MNTFTFSKSYGRRLQCRLSALMILLLSFAFASKLNAQVSLTATGGTTTGTFTTLNAAFTAINAGTHTGVITISITGNTTEPATPVPLLASAGTSSYTSIIIRPSGGNFTINSAAAPVTNRAIIELAGADNVTIDGDDPATAGLQNLSIVAATVTTAGVGCIRLSSNSTTGTDGADNNTIKNCIITGARSTAVSTTTSYGIQFSNGVAASSSSTGAYSSVNTLIQNNVITKCYYGILAIGNSTSYYNTGTQIINNVIGSATAANNVGLNGILMTYSSGTTTGAAIIEGNDIQCGDFTTGFSANPGAINLAANANYVIVRKNNIHDVANSSSSGYGAYGIAITSTNTGVNIYNNFIRDITAQNYSTGLTSTYQNYGIYISSSSTGTIINHNTIYINKPNATTYGTSNPVSACINMTSTGSVLAQLQNNILVNTQGAASTSAYCIITSANTNISGGVVNNNAYYCTAKIGYYGGTAYATLSSWQSGTGKDGLSITENPAFTSATNLHIPDGTLSFLESAGASVASTGISTDIDGQTRPGPSTYGFGTAPDIGADEFDGNVIYTCVTPVPGATIASANNICLNTPVTFSTANATAGTGVTYKWQSSTNNVTYTDIAGATSATYTTVPTAPLYYRAVVTCINGPVSVNSTPVQITFANTITSTTPGVRCGTGTVNLAATSPVGTGLKWYTSDIGGVSVGAGSPFTTPIITSTTNYYVGSETITTGSTTVGAGALTGSAICYDPFNGGYGGMKGQYLFTAAELQAAGLSAGPITSLGLDIVSAGATDTAFTIQMGTTSLSEFPTPVSILGGLTTYYSTPFFVPVVGINSFALTTPFVWDGVSNVVVSTSWSNGNTSNTASSVRYDVTTNYASQAYRKDSETPANLLAATGVPTGGTLARSLDRPKMIFNGQIACGSARSLVVATVNAAPVLTISQNQTVCNNAITTLNVTSPLANYNSYVWVPNTNLYTDPAATIPYTGTTASTVYFKSSTPGQVVYTLTANNSTTLCAQVATDTLIVLPASGVATATPPSSCNSGSAVLTLAPATGYGAGTIQWQSSTNNTAFTDITGATGNTYTTPVLTSSLYYRAAVKNSAGSVCFTSTSDTALILNPAVTSTTPAARCGAGSVTLGATGVDGILNWYAASTGGTSLGTGPSFTTPSIAATTNFWVESSTAGSSNVGPAANVAALSYFITTAWGITFDCTAPTTIQSVAVYPQSAGTMTIAVQSSMSSPTIFGTYVATFTAAQVGTKVVLPINIYIPTPGTGYKMVVQSYTGLTGLHRESSPGTGFPYTATGSPVTLTSSEWGGTTTSTFYFFYDWVISSLCGSARTQVTATVNPKPDTSVTASGPVAFCPNSNVTFTAAAGLAGYQWLLNNNIIPGATNATFTANQAGSYRVKVSNATCTDTSTARVVTIIPGPIATITAGGPTTFCDGDSVKLSGPQLVSGTTYQWQQNGTNIAGATDTTYTARTSGAYRLVMANATCSDTSMVTTVTVNPLPSIVVSPASAAVCSGTSITLTASGASTYSWSPTASLSAGTGASVVATPLTNTTYTITAIGTNGCTNTTTKTVTVAPAPTVDVLPATATVCAGGNITLTASGAQTYSWSPATGLSATTGASVTASPTTTTTYTVVGDDGIGCTATTTKTVTVLPLPVIGVNPATPTTVCAGVSTTLTANGGVSYSWSPATGLNTTTGATVLATPTTTTTYTVTGTGANGCTNTATKLITVNALPPVAISPASAGICAGSSIGLTASGATTYSWSPATNLTPTTGANVTASPTTTTTYTVTGTGANGCVATATRQVTVTPLPTVNITPTAATAICAGGSVNISGTGATTYNWSPATGLSSTTGTTVVASPTTTTTYTVVGSTNGCTGTATKTITVNALPPAVVTAGGPTAFCQGSNVLLTANGGTGYSYTWRTNGAVNGNTGQTFTATATGTYDVIVSNGTCTNTSNATLVTVSTPPVTTVSVSGSTTFCQGSSVTLSAQSNAGYTYQWQLNTINIAGANSASYTATTAGDYRVVVTNGACSGTSATTTVTVNANPPAQVLPQGATTFCEGGAVSLFASVGNGYSYQWTLNGVNIPSANSPVYVATASGDYGAIVTNGASCTSVAPPVTVEVVPAGLPVIVVTGGNNLSTAAPYAAYQWYRDGSPIAGATSRNYTATISGSYRVEVTILLGCTRLSEAVLIGNVGVSGVAKGTVSFFPNPASTIVTFTSDRAINVSVAGVDGKEVLRVEDVKTLDIAGLADGVYVLRITDKNGQLLRTDKLIKTVR